MKNLDQTIISQYAASPIIKQLIYSIDEWISPDANLEQFYQLIWNLDTAQGYGLDVWGRIVGIGRVLTITTTEYFGFAEAAPDWEGFGQAPFYSGQPLTSNYTLSDEAYRLLILAKAAANITDCSIPAINRILMNLFPNRGNCYVMDTSASPPAYFGFAEAGDAEGFDQAPFADYAPPRPSAMSMVYVFDFPLQPFEASIVTSSGVLPKPVGVLATASYPPS